MATKKAKPKKLSDEELADSLYISWVKTPFNRGDFWRHLAASVRRLAREGKL